MAQRTIFTLGYQKRAIEEYVAVLQEAGVRVVVDVRETAWSHKPGFSKSALEGRLSAAGIEYRHAAFAGNPKELRKTAESHEACLTAYAAFLSDHPDVLVEFGTLIEELLDSERYVCLLCYERHPDDCHRSILLEQWMAETESPPTVEHLGKEGAERFLTG
jgi:uncharacterized protein (DUF488 family)